MKVLIDIGHPAHVHFFRNAIRELEGRGHEGKADGAIGNIELPIHL
jgi:predicted glycosyltransferase